jgi:UDP-N-acetylglucosamine 1-carboxyvinyltransferase
MATDLGPAPPHPGWIGSDGRNRVSRVYHLDRGYEGLDKKLANMGADIKRIKEGD